MVVNSIIGVGPDLSGQLHLFDGETLGWRAMRIPPDTGCRACASA
jgi:hypothetical protein